jgi:hypothetical protein
MSRAPPTVFIVMTGCEVGRTAQVIVNWARTALVATGVAFSAAEASRDASSKAHGTPTRAARSAHEMRMFLAPFLSFKSADVRANRRGPRSPLEIIS